MRANWGGASNFTQSLQCYIEFLISKIKNNNKVASLQSRFFLEATVCQVLTQKFILFSGTGRSM